MFQTIHQIYTSTMISIDFHQTVGKMTHIHIPRASPPRQGPATATAPNLFDLKRRPKNTWHQGTEARRASRHVDRPMLESHGQPISTSCYMLQVLHRKKHLFVFWDAKYDAIACLHHEYGYYRTAELLKCRVVIQDWHSFVFFLNGRQLDKETASSKQSSNLATFSK